jgi:hypothetical protein
LNPINEIQLSAELEQLRVNVNDGSNTNSQNYWNTDYLWEQVTALATPLVRYNVLTDKNNIYGSAFMPFVFILILRRIQKEGDSIFVLKSQG